MEVPRLGGQMGVAAEAYTTATATHILTETTSCPQSTEPQWELQFSFFFFALQIDQKT